MLVSTSIRAQTTMEEYNYVTKGYKVQVESGLDMKKGYRFEDITSHKAKSADLGIILKTEFKALYRGVESKPCALLCIFSKSSETEKQYLCIPSFASSPEVWDLAMKRILDFSGEDQAAICIGFAILASYYSGK
jgi:hypothetical protein